MRDFTICSQGPTIRKLLLTIAALLMAAFSSVVNAAPSCGQPYPLEAAGLRIDLVGVKVVARSKRNSQIVWVVRNVLPVCSWVKGPDELRSLAGLVAGQVFLVVHRNNMIEAVSVRTGKHLFWIRTQTQAHMDLKYFASAKVFTVDGTWVYNLSTKKQWVLLQPDKAYRASVTASMSRVVIAEYVTTGARMVNHSFVVDASEGRLLKDFHGRWLYKIAGNTAFFKSDDMYDPTYGPDKLHFSWFNSTTMTDGFVAVEYHRVRKGCTVDYSTSDGGTIDMLEFEPNAIKVMYVDCQGTYWLDYDLNHPDSPKIRLLMNQKR